MKKVVLVTGASKGIGKATAIEFARKDYNVVINYHSDDNGAEEVKKYIIENYDVDVMVYKADVSKEDEVKNMVDRIVNRFGKIDVLVNNTGIAIDTTFEDKTVENFKKILDVNLIGQFICAKEVSKHMLKEGSGTIINISSTNGFETYYPYSLDYDASKAGVISLTHNLAVEFAPIIRVNSVAPGWVNTEMNKELDTDYVKEECEKIGKIYEEMTKYEYKKKGLTRKGRIRKVTEFYEVKPGLSYKEFNLYINSLDEGK